MVSFLSKLVNFVIYTTNKHNIDESHSLGHSLDVLNFANQIYDHESKKHPYLEKHKKIIYVSAMVHDMCDRKYVDEYTGLNDIQEFLKHCANDTLFTGGQPSVDVLDKNEIDIVSKIITQMSYSKVKKSGYPDLGEYQLAYHIVREADLLSAYDFDRCMMYIMHKYRGTAENSFQNAYDLFQARMLQHNIDGLFVTDYSKKLSLQLHEQSLIRMESWKRIMNLRTNT
jgi:hypothetical protein